ncbi:uncharacterized protein LOC113487744 isoform X2 [Athene cunicularia]|uniref:uncharacterized protein LOC113487744 isoform X2 n=1 Tax=Athene cunicularia TaxID=194338 RepID=UPI000EF7122F|nr:uncharacterized protein LOC113487744 isoform X2 [Athene cunicularia]
MFRSIVNFTVLSAEQKPKLLLCLCILLISLHDITLLHNIISATGVLWACLKVTISIIAILKELKPLVWIFLSQNVPEVVYLIYLLYTVIRPTYLLDTGARGWRPPLHSWIPGPQTGASFLSNPFVVAPVGISESSRHIPPLQD